MRTASQVMVFFMGVLLLSPSLAFARCGGGWGGWGWGWRGNSCNYGGYVGCSPNIGSCGSGYSGFDYYSCGSSDVYYGSYYNVVPTYVVPTYVVPTYGEIYAPKAILAPQTTKIQRKIRTERPSDEYLPSVREIKRRMGRWIDYNDKITSLDIIKIRTRGQTIWAPVVNNLMPQARPYKNYYKFTFDLKIPFHAGYRADVKAGKVVSYNRSSSKYKGMSLASHYLKKRDANKFAKK